MAQNIIYNPWETTKGAWLWLMTILLLFGLLWLFSFVLAFLTSLIKLILWLKFSTGQRQRTWWRGKDRTVLLRFIFIVGACWWCCVCVCVCHSFYHFNPLFNFLDIWGVTWQITHWVFFLNVDHLYVQGIGHLAISKACKAYVFYCYSYIIPQ